MAWRKAVMTSSDNAHVHTYTGTQQNPNINSGYWGQTGSKLKPGDILEIDLEVSVERVESGKATETWTLGRYLGSTGFIRAAKVFPCTFWLPLRANQLADTEQFLAEEIQARRAFILKLGQAYRLYFNAPPVYVRSVFGERGRDYVRRASTAEGWVDPDAVAAVNALKLAWRQQALTELRLWRASAVSNAAYDGLPLIDGFGDLTAGVLMIEALLTGKPGFFLGESHNEWQPKKFLIANMKHLRRSSVRVIYLEHFQHDLFQHLFDAFYESNEEAPTGHLKRLIKTSDEAHLAGRLETENLAGLVKEAKRYDIRIALIDDLASSLETTEFRDDRSRRAKERVLRMNFKAKALMAKEQEGKRGRWVALVGRAHVHTHAGVIPGLAQLCAARAVTVNDAGTKLLASADTIANRQGQEFS